MVAALWFSESLGSNYNAGKLPLVGGVPVDPIATPSALISKGVVTACQSFTATTITFTAEQWAGFSTAPVAGDSACIELSGTGAGQYIVTFTDVTNRVCTWAGGTTNGISGVTNLNTSGTFVRCGVGGARLNPSSDMFALGGCLSHFGSTKLTVSNNHICWLDGEFDVVAPTRSIMLPNFRGLPEGTINITSGTSLTTMARAYISTRNVRITGVGTIGVVNPILADIGIGIDCISSLISGVDFTQNTYWGYSQQRISAPLSDGYAGLLHSAYINIKSEIAGNEHAGGSSYIDPLQVDKSLLHFSSSVSSAGRGIIHAYTSGAGKQKDSILTRDDSGETAAMCLVMSGYSTGMDEQYNDMRDASSKCSTYNGTNYYTTPRSGSNNIYSADQKWSVNADGYIVLAADSPCVGTASDGANKGPCNITIAGDASITINRGESASVSWTITDAAGTSSVVKPYISTGTLPAGLALSTFGYSPLTATISGKCTASAGDYVVVLRGSNGVTASYKTITITVVEPHIYPVADAGADQSVGISATVNLDGTGSTDAASYAWVQTSGAHTVTLVNPTTATPSFTAPAVDDVLTFQLTVTSSTGDTDTDEVTVTVSLATATLSVAKVGKGSIISDAGNPIYGASGSYTVTHGEAIRLEARPAHGYKFTAWSGAAVDSSPILTLTMDDDKSITGTFLALEDGRRAAPLRMPPYRGRPIR